MQYKKVTSKMNTINPKDKGTSPIKFPSAVNGSNIPASISVIDEIYTALCALLWKNGSFAVLIMCIPIRFEVML